jgi:uncharacterized protein
MKKAAKQLKERITTSHLILSKTNPMNPANKLIKKLGLTRHPEGGWFKEVYRSNEYILAQNLPVRFEEDHCFSTSIYFLLKGDDFSALHRIKQDETWHLYSGSSMTLHIIDEKGSYNILKLGLNLEKGEQPQQTVKAGCIFGATVDNKDTYTLAGCTVAPGFEFSDFELLSRQNLIEKYPHHSNIIMRLTR